LLDTVDGSEMALEDVCAIEGFLGSATRARAETADHVAFVVSEGMALAVVFACETFAVVFAPDDGAFFRTLVLMGEHVSFEVAEFLAAGLAEGLLGIASFLCAW
jgi:hypothetical protein